MKKLVLILWLLGLLTSVCFGNEWRASDVANGSIVFILQATIAYIVFGVIWKILKKKDSND